MLSKSGFDVCNKPALELPNASADRFVRGAHHRRCAREGLTAAMMPYPKVSCKHTTALYVPATKYIPHRQYMSDVVNTEPPIMIVPRLDKLLGKEKRNFYWLAKATCVSHTTLWRLKKGKSAGINFDTLDKICRALRCQPGDVLFLTKDKTPLRRQASKKSHKA